MRNGAVRRIIQRKREGRKGKMPTELLQEFIGKRCTVVMLGDISVSTGVITAVEGNWIRVEYKNTAKLINGDMISRIEILPEKKK